MGLQRDAVGEHILLGGDNMDLALAHVVGPRLKRSDLDPWQSVALWHSCREAKEKLLTNPDLHKIPVNVLGRGSSIVGGLLKATLNREDIENVLMQGFFPMAAANDYGAKTRKIGFSQWDLPYASEPAITKQIARFLHQHRPEGKDFIAPTAVLFNGGVLSADCFRQRLVEVINTWLTKENYPPLKVLPAQNFDLAVARGATYYGNAQQGQGIRIRGGTAHSYYIGIESSMPAVPGMELPMKALCIIPAGMEEGTSAEVPSEELGLIVGESVEFPFFSSHQRKQDPIGSMINIGEDLQKQASIETTLNAGDNIQEGEMVPVKLNTHVTEIGTLEVSCRSLDGKHQWNLEFNIRETVQ